MSLLSQFRSRARVLGAVAVVGAVAGTAGFATLPAHAAVHAPATVHVQDAASVKPGLTGPAITVANNVQLSQGYDLATGPNGTAYLGWIGDNGSGRKVSLCTLPRGAKTCAGGIRTVPSAATSLEESGAQGLHVFVDKNNKVTLVWMHDTIASENGPEGSEIAVATSQGGGPLTGPSDVSPAPSFGYFIDAALAPNGKIWTVTEPTGAATDSVQVTRGLGTKYQTVKTPFSLGAGELGFKGSAVVLAIDKAGSITQPVYYATQTSTGWTGFRAVPRTWDVGGFGLAGTTAGFRLIASENNAGYHPVVSALTSSGFSVPVLTGDTNNCEPADHDVVTDASGRLADVSRECQAVTVANLANTKRAAIFRFSIPASATFAGGDPQLTTAPSGRGWVAWSVESKTGDKLTVAPLVLAGLDVAAVSSSKAGKVSVTGPTSCLPPVNVAVGVGAKAAPGWTVLGKSVKLNGATVGATLKGAGLAPGKTYTLTGTVTFGKGSSRSIGRAVLKFRSCPTP